MRKLYSGNIDNRNPKFAKRIRHGHASNSCYHSFPVPALREVNAFLYPSRFNENLPGLVLPNVVVNTGDNPSAPCG
ncbi:hypothetical protein SDC9_161252 [bioreactor metagenome]|uniref:Uncharacterized protein n=1 Tax=bioreactor metagenome TaxID=1076179 RepID=A0A645FJT7_9ZZZZ